MCSALTLIVMSKFYFFGLFLFCFGDLIAQNTDDERHKVGVGIPEIALLDIEANGSKDISLGIEAPRQAGNSAIFEDQPVDNLWLNYTSIINANPSSLEKKRSVFVKIASGVVPGGIDLMIKANDDAQQGKGSVGLPKVAWMAINSNDQELIRNIRSGHTGNGAGKGHQLLLKLRYSNGGADYNLLDANQNETEVVLVYTISDI